MMVFSLLCWEGRGQSGAGESGLGMAEQPLPEGKTQSGFPVARLPRWKRSAKCYWSSSRGSICWEVAGTSPSLSWYSLRSGGIGNGEALAFCRGVELGREEDCHVWTGGGRQAGKLKDDQLLSWVNGCLVHGMPSRAALVLSDRASASLGCRTRKDFFGYPQPSHPDDVLRALGFLEHSLMPHILPFLNVHRNEIWVYSKVLEGVRRAAKQDISRWVQSMVYGLCLS